VNSASPQIVNLFVDKNKLDQDEEMKLSIEVKDIW
jgi:hypothetical protein